jgi:hypothetical protein
MISYAKANASSDTLYYNSETAYIHYISMELAYHSGHRRTFSIYD